MGTNYYLRKRKCESCGHHPEGLHIGKKSFGWYFLFMAYNYHHPVIESFKNWLDVFKDDTYFIFNEYGDEMSKENFINMIQNDYMKEDQKYNYEMGYLDEDGYLFSTTEFL